MYACVICSVLAAALGFAALALLVVINIVAKAFAKTSRELCGGVSIKRLVAEKPMDKCLG